MNALSMSTLQVSNQVRCAVAGFATLVLMQTIRAAPAVNATAAAVRRISARGSNTPKALIDRLGAVSEFSATRACTHGVDGVENEFWPVSPPAPAVSSAMSELVSAGTTAVPELLRHLRDERPSRVVLRSAGNSRLWYGDIYDPRTHPSPHSFPLVNTRTVETYWASGPGHPTHDLDSYTVKIGDLCFVALGKIVNRCLNTATGTPANFIISSPVTNPALAAAARRDWAGLTPNAHRRSLVFDAQHDLDRGHARDAVIRLCYWYPDAGQLVTQRLLSRKLQSTDDDPALPFVARLLEVSSPRERLTLLRNFSRHFGPRATRSVTLWLVRCGRRRESEIDGLPELDRIAARRERARARAILRHAFPGTEPLIPPVDLCIDPGEAAELIRSLDWFPSRGIDQVALSLMRKGWTAGHSGGRWDRLGMAVISRLRGKGHDAELIAYCEQRLAAIERNSNSVSDGSRERWLVALRGIKKKEH